MGEGVSSVREEKCIRTGKTTNRPVTIDTKTCT